SRTWRAGRVRWPRRPASSRPTGPWHCPACRRCRPGRSRARPRGAPCAPCIPACTARRRTRSAWPRDSGLDGRIVAAVRGALEKVLGLVRPELGDERIGVDDGVHELGARLVHAIDVHVLGWIAVLVELDGPAGIGSGLDGAADGGDELLAVFHP